MTHNNRDGPPQSHVPTTLSRFGSSRSNNEMKPASASASSQSSRQQDQQQSQQHLIASASSKVVIHKIDNSVPIAIVNEPHSGWEIGAVAWSHNNMILATCGQNDCQIALAKVADGSIIQEMEVCPKGISITDVCFSSKSTFIAFGCDDASVGIVNIRQKRVETAIRDHDQAYSIKSVAFNCYDTLLASASSDGELIVNALTPDADSETHVANRIFRDRSMRSSLTMARFSFTKRHVLATAYESGLVCIWDLQSVVQLKEGKENIAVGGQPPNNPLRHKFSAHSNICSGIAFSPVNNLLLCTAGLDSRIFFFDIVEGKQVKKIDVGTPLSAISFCADGHTIGVGTQQSGQVVIYDLKDSKRVKIELKGHDRTQKISALQFSRLQKPQPSQTNQTTNETQRTAAISRTGSSQNNYSQSGSHRNIQPQAQQNATTQRPPARPITQQQNQQLQPMIQSNSKTDIAQKQQRTHSNSPMYSRSKATDQPVPQGMSNTHSQPQHQSSRVLIHPRDKSPLNNRDPASQNQIREEAMKAVTQHKFRNEKGNTELDARTLEAMRNVNRPTVEQPEMGYTKPQMNKTSARNNNEPSSYNPNSNVPSSYNPNANAPAQYNPNSNAPVGYSASNNAPIGYSANSNAPAAYNPNVSAPSPYSTDKMKAVAKENIQEMKEQMKQELTGPNAMENMQTMQTSNSRDNLPEHREAMEEPGQDNRLKDVDMMDVEELQNKRDQEESKQPFVVAPKQTGLTYEQKQLIESIIDEKQSVYIDSLKRQFNNMHLELIRNFQAQESDMRGILQHVAAKNKVKKVQLQRLQDENKELRKIQF